MKKFEKKIQLKDDEQVDLLLRRYWLSMMYRLILGVALFVTPFFFMVPLFSRGTLGIVIFAIILLLGVYLIFRTIWVWYNDVFVITNNRIIDINQRGLFDTVVSEAMLERVDDVSYRQKGPLQSLLKYGTVYIQTDGDSLVLEMGKVPKPNEIHNRINELVTERFQNDRKMKFKKLVNTINFSSWHDDEVVAMMDKMLDELGEDRFVRAIAEFIDLEDN